MATNQHSTVQYHSTAPTHLFLFLVILLRLPVQLKGIPNASSLDFVRRSQTICDRINRGLYGSVNEHGWCRIERCGGGLRSGNGWNGVARSLDWWRGNEGICHGEESRKSECWKTDHYCKEMMMLSAGLLVSIDLCLWFLSNIMCMVTWDHSSIMLFRGPPAATSTTLDNAIVLKLKSTDALRTCWRATRPLTCHFPPKWVVQKSAKVGLLACTK